MRKVAEVVLLLSLAFAAVFLLPGFARAEATYPDVSSNYAYDDAGDRTNYDYTVRHRGSDWQFVSFSVFAPIASGLVTAQSTFFNGQLWAGTKGSDGFGGCVIYWAPTTTAAGLTYHQQIAFHISVAGQVNTVLQFKYKDPGGVEHDTNWTYEAYGNLHGVYDGEGDASHRFVAVPSIPEPASLLALCGGLAALTLRRRR